MPSSLSDYDFVVNTVQPFFRVKELYLREDGSVEFRLYESAKLKQDFVALVQQLKAKGYAATLRGSEGELVLTVFKFSPRAQFKRRTPFLLFLMTLATVTTDGFLRSSLFPAFNMLQMVILYTLGIIGIVGIHELGHKVASHFHRMKSSYPFFIPGIPGFWPTLGAVITSGDPPVNRDALFDLGLSGPMAGLLATLLVAVGGAITTYTLPIEEMNRLVASEELRSVERLDMFTAYLLDVFKQPQEGTGVVLSPLLFASSIGFLITFLNLLPAWQLDGGHIARALLGSGKHRLVTYASIAVMFALGFRVMALLLLLLSYRSPEMRLLDDVSPLSRGRAIAFAMAFLLASSLYIFTIRDNPHFFL